MKQRQSITILVSKAIWVQTLWRLEDLEVN